ncbi:ArnT family glycosyltransferase [Hymenobacter aerophilus]|uniref:ArnT family glycosyltransferase n=1 Tax=Hymenobacter aerophilus TaxID=119644 RepID=UPI00037714F3|nr:glycosyltransferase family 39 protein [Hymenobacter aerophilus]
MLNSATAPLWASSLVSRFRRWFSRPESYLLLLLLLATFPLYYELGRNPVQLYDESRVAVNAVEMTRNGHWLTTYYDGSPDHWNTKPPLLIWLQALSFTAFGYSTWALRLPTLLASMGTVLLVFFFAARVLKRPVGGLLAGMVLATSAGYVRLHVARTGDYDALLTFWQVLLWISFFCYLETEHRRYLGWLTVALLAAALTKGPAALLGLPGLAAYAIWHRKLGWLLRRPDLYMAAGLWLLVMSAYFLLREPLDPGYWQAVQANDLGGRLVTTLDNHRYPWDYYIQNIRGHYFTAWLWAIFPAIIISLIQPEARLRRITVLLVAFVSSWLLVISYAQTKLDWYDAPIYPALALLIGLGLNTLYKLVHNLGATHLSRGTRWLSMVALACAVFYLPYQAITQQLITERHSNFGIGANSDLGRYVTRIARQQPQYPDVTLLTDGMANSMMLYYKAEFEQHPKHHLTILSENEIAKLTPGTVVVLCNPALHAALGQVFNLVEIGQNESCQTVLLLPK